MDPSIGAVVDGCPPGLPLNESDLQRDLDRRRPGQSKYTTQRHEADEVRILSGVFEGVTTGTPIGLVIDNTDQRSRDYSKIQDVFRPAHADYTYQKKYGIRDYRGGGRSSARETAMRVAAGAIAKKYLAQEFGATVRGYLAQIGDIRPQTDRLGRDRSQSVLLSGCSCRSADRRVHRRLRKDGDSIGARVTVVASGLPVGLGEPVFDKLDADIARALMSINAVKGVETRRRLRRRAAARYRTSRRNDNGRILEQQRRRCAGRDLHRSGHRRKHGAEADIELAAAGAQSQRTRRRSGSRHHRAPRSVCGYPSHTDRGGDAGARVDGPPDAPARAESQLARQGLIAPLYDR